MNYVYIFFIAAIILIASGSIFYFFRKSNKKNDSASFDLKTPKIKKSSATPQFNNELNVPPKTDHKLNALKRELMTIVLHNQRTYQNNLEIARRDFLKRNIQNPSETELHERAIEIWRDDNR